MNAHCQNCGAPLSPPKRASGNGKRFCDGRCRAAFHRKGGMPGQIKAVRALKNGGFSVTVFYPSPPPIQPGTMVKLMSGQ